MSARVFGSQPTENLMSENQAIITIIAVVVISVLIWVGFGMFLDAHKASQKDDFVSAMNDIGATATVFRQKPKSMGGGGGEYIGFALPDRLTSIDAGTIFAVVEPRRIFVVGHSRRGYGSVSAVIDGSGRVGHISVEGEF
jgi:hypothetical protein